MIIMIFTHIQSIFYLYSDFHSNPSWRNQMEPLDSKASGVARYHISGLTPHVVSATTTTSGESVSKERIMAAFYHDGRRKGARKTIGLKPRVGPQSKKRVESSS